MSEYRTILQPARMLIADRLEEPNAGKCERVLNIGLLFGGTENNTCHAETASLRSPKHSPNHPSTSLIAKVRTLLTALLLGVMAAGCNKGSSEDLVPDKDMVAVPVGAVAHYGSGIGIPGFSINGKRISNSLGWGGGVAGDCCVLLPRLAEEPMVVTVKWTTKRSDVGEMREHVATVPIHFAVQPGLGGSGLYVHFLPGHKVEIWYASPWPSSGEYPGPKYPGGPAPPYEPLPDEAPRREAPASE